jgi:hypothetical protein
MQEGDQEARYSILTSCACKVKALESSSKFMAYHRTRLSGIASIESSTCPNCNHYDRHKPSEQLHGLLMMPLVQSFHGEMQQKIRDWRRTGVSRSETQSESISGATGQAEWLLDSIRLMNREYKGLTIPLRTVDSRRYNFNLKDRNHMDMCHHLCFLYSKLWRTMSTWSSTCSTTPPPTNVVSHLETDREGSHCLPRVAS